MNPSFENKTPDNEVPRVDPRKGMIEDPNPYATAKPTVKITDAIEQAPKEEGHTNTIRTFQSDIAGAVKSDNVSMIKIALAEKERREHEGSYADVDAPKKPKTIFYVLGGVFVFIALGVGGVYLYFNQAPELTLEQIIAPQEPDIIYSETQVMLNADNVNPAVLLQEIKEEGLKKFDLGTVKRILLTTSTGSTTRNITTNEFLTNLRTRAPAELLRAMEPYFVAGTYSFTPHDTFLIFKINSYDSAYAAMLAWEPYMETDIGGMFISEGEGLPGVAPAIATTTEKAVTDFNTGTTSTTTTTTVAPAKPVITTNDKTAAVFRDKILQNKDTRVLIAPDGSLKFLYSFLDKQTLVIVSSEKGLKEILFRTTSGRIIR